MCPNRNPALNARQAGAAYGRPGAAPPGMRAQSLLPPWRTTLTASAIAATVGVFLAGLVGLSVLT
jgi:hypothetical protein